MSNPEYQLTTARFGASVVNFQGRTWVVGGIIQNEILNDSDRFVSIDNQFQVSRAVLSRTPSSIPQPLLIGSSLVSKGNSLLVMGGSAVCFSFGTFWNKGCYTLRLVDGAGKGGLQSSYEAPKSWSFLHTAVAANSKVPLLQPPTLANSMTNVPRVRITSAAGFEQITRSGKPVVMEGLDLGSCTDWTSGYLKEKIGSNREVSFTTLIIMRL